MTIHAKPKSIEHEDPSQWVDHYGDAMLQFAYARLDRLDLAEDVVQETFLAAWQARGTFDARSSLGTWLFAILKRKIADHFRRVGRRPGEVATEPQTSEFALFTAGGKWTAAIASWCQTPDTLAENAEFWEVLAKCLADLPAHLAQAFHLRELGLASMDEICRLTGVTPQNLAVRLHRARALLRQCLERNWVLREPGE